MTGDRCWICLGTEDDRPPLAGPGDSKALIAACGCSLKVHKRCLLDWTANFVMKSRQDGAFTLNVNRNPQFVLRNETGPHLMTLKPTNGLKVFTNSELKCPQCQTPFMLTSKPSALLRFTNLLKIGGKRITYYTLLTTVGVTITGAIMVSVFSVLTSVGYKLFKRIAPESVIMRLLSINERTLENALTNNKINLRHLSLISGFPIFLLSLRGNNIFASSFSNLYPLCFFKDLWNFNVKDSKNFLLFAQPLNELYTLLFRLTFNRFHYRLIRGINTCFLGNELPLEEIEDIEGENQEFEELEYERITQNEVTNPNWFQKFHRYFLPNYSERARKILQKRREREFRMTSKNDYSQLLGMRSRALSLLTTFLWPFAGEIIGKALVRVPWIRAVSNQFVQTPDESSYLINLLGCCIAVLLKDLGNLYITWKYCKQFKNIDVLDMSFKGFEIVKQQTPEETQTTEGHPEGGAVDAGPQFVDDLGFPGAWVDEPAVNNVVGQRDADADADGFNNDGDNAGFRIAINYGDILNTLIETLNGPPQQRQAN